MIDVEILQFSIDYMKEKYSKIFDIGSNKIFVPFQIELIFR